MRKAVERSDSLEPPVTAENLKTHASIQARGYSVIDFFLTEAECADLLQQVAEYRRRNPLQEIYRPAKPRPLRYKVIDGNAIRENLPQIWNLYTGALHSLVNQASQVALSPLANSRAGVNVNLMAPERSVYRWHYDRNLVTGILYLNTVEGGQTELYPNYRLLLKNGRYLRVQRWLDRLIHFPPIRRVFGKKVVVRPKAGRLLLMRGNTCWHSVGAVTGDQERINIIFAFDSPGAEHKMQESLDSDLYSRDQHGFKDPNYGI